MDRQRLYNSAAWQSRSAMALFRFARRCYGLVSGTGTGGHSLADGALKRKLRDPARPPIVCCLTNMQPETSHVEMLGAMGWLDFLWLECEHSAASASDCMSTYVAAERRGLPCVTRVGCRAEDRGHMMKHLVSGSMGIIFPTCESADQVRQVVEAVKFPPLGKRGVAGDRWCSWGLSGDDLGTCVEMANENSVVGVMIETLEGVERLDEITQVDGSIFVASGRLICQHRWGSPGSSATPRSSRWSSRWESRSWRPASPRGR